MASPAETTAMRSALALARGALGTTNPNPAVGAVVLDRNGREAGAGVTAPVGGPHAEVVALTAAGESARGGTLVVTLEPCAHRGRTGACAQAVVAAGIARVVYAATDPNAVASGGVDLLRDAGVDVEAGLLLDEAEAELGPWLVAMGRGRPHVTWKYAATMDGRTAARDGTSRWITGEAARADVHQLRARADAVVIGIGTLLADDPALTVRAVDVGRQPVRVVVDSHARTPVGSKLLDGAAPALIAVTASAPAKRRAALRDAGAEVIEVASKDGRVDLGSLVSTLFARELYLLLVEGGATLAAGFVGDGLVDRVVGYLAPALLGAGSDVLGGFGVGTINDVKRLRLRDVAAMGDDVRIIAELGGA
ncbi:MAG TPA: bifunctional diaminohydroxyphosphoribosylaminopyrimidine deaminase/5-amino-6-(5-phosphoribosylamino)uracil reductase RibD [Mycobacteriales bacterium]|nr:bifunctional diaminohydroxyphosphoribosylaminopyrimidine deaminase/5-amino-6-(5-phosphoribosylamino)uracil reductase RibD [Mycobacteriales bacterium]